MSGLLAWWLLFAPTMTADVAEQLARLKGHQVTVAADGASITIVDIAGEGAPVVGVVERRGDALWLVDDGGGAQRLRGPLAIPRIAGPGYRVWVVGERNGSDLRARRLGVLARPKR